MGWMLFLIQMIPVIIKLIDFAETIYENSKDRDLTSIEVEKQGPNKKQFVMVSVKSMVEEKINKQRDAEDIESVWEKLEGPISEYIDKFCHDIV